MTRPTPGRSGALLAAVVAVAVLVGACGETDDAPAAPSTSTSSTADVYHGDENTPRGKDEAGTDGGDANPDAENTDR